MLPSAVFSLKSPGFWRDFFSPFASKGKNKHIKFAGNAAADCLEAHDCIFCHSLCSLQAFKILVGLAWTNNKREINALFGYFGAITVGGGQNNNLSIRFRCLDVGRRRKREEVVAPRLLGTRDFLHVESPPQGLSAPCSDRNEEARPCAVAVKGVQSTCELLWTGEGGGLAE